METALGAANRCKWLQLNDLWNLVRSPCPPQRSKASKIPLKLTSPSAVGPAASSASALLAIQPWPSAVVPCLLPTAPPVFQGMPGRSRRRPATPRAVQAHQREARVMSKTRGRARQASKVATRRLQTLGHLSLARVVSASQYLAGAQTGICSAPRYPFTTPPRRPESSAPEMRK